MHRFRVTPPCSNPGSALNERSHGRPGDVAPVWKPVVAGGKAESAGEQSIERSDCNPGRERVVNADKRNIRLRPEGIPQTLTVHHGRLIIAAETGAASLDQKGGARALSQAVLADFILGQR